MEQLVRLEINGEDKTKNSSNHAISREVNRFYDIATFLLCEKPKTFDTVSLTAGSINFEGFIYTVDKVDAGRYSVECRTVGGLLTEPFFSATEHTVDPVKTSHDLCDYYADRFGVPISNTAVNLDFGGDYERTGTPLQALETIANVTGAEFWWDGSKIVISPNKPVPQQAKEIPARDIFEFIPEFNTIENEGIGTLIVGSSSHISSVTTSNKCDVEIGECSSTVKIYIVPHDSFSGANGIHSINPIIEDLKYSEIVNNEISIQLKAEIKEIGKITVDGIEVNDYTYKYDTVVFSSLVRGRVTINYLGYGYTGELETFMFGGEKRYRYDIVYAGCEVLSEDGAIACSGNIDSSSTRNCDCATVITPSKMNYFTGFMFRTIGCVPHITFTDGHITYPGHVETEVENVAYIDIGYLSAYDGSPTEEARRHFLRQMPVTVSEVKSKGVDIPYTVDGQYILFDKYYPDVLIAYTTAGHKHTVNFKSAVRGDLTMIVNGCEYRIGGEDDLNPNATEGDRVAVDIVGELGCNIHDAVNRPVAVTDPNGAISTLYVDSLGFVYIDNAIKGTYFFDTNTIIPNSWVKMFVSC